MLLELSNIKKSYLSPESGEKREVLKGITLSVEEGESCAICGPSGSGKSTLLHIMGLLDTPAEGTLFVRGGMPAPEREKERAAYRNREIGFVFQLHYLLPQYTVLENVMLPAAAHSALRRDSGQVRKRALALLERVGLGVFLRSRPGELSGGEQQRVAFVRALINSPSLLLADEPTGSLDRTAALAVAVMMRELNREEGVALVVVTHSDEIARAMNTVLRLSDGLLVPADQQG
jgi:lipoprotein-releasing system ATP-binding protein